MELIAAISPKLYRWWAARKQKLRGLTFLEMEKLLAKNLGIGCQNGSPFGAQTGVLSMEPLMKPLPKSSFFP